MSMEIEVLTEEQLAGRLRAQYQRIETENQHLRDLLATLLVINGPLELPADLPPNFARQWDIKKKRVRKKVVLSAVMTHAKAVA